MKKTALIAVATAAMLTLGTIPGYATEVTGSTVTVAPKDKTAIQAFKSAMAAFKVDLAAYKLARGDYSARMAAYREVMKTLKPALVTYRLAKKQISQTFVLSIQSAQNTYELAISGDVAAEQKLAAKTAFDEAKASALATRKAAIAALGPAPVKPAAPVKPTKPTKPVRP